MIDKTNCRNVRNGRPNAEIGTTGKGNVKILRETF